MWSSCRYAGCSPPPALAVAGAHPSAHRLPLVFYVVFQVGGATYALRQRVVRTRGLLGRSCHWRAVRRTCAPRIVVAHAAINGGAHLPWSSRNEYGFRGP